MVTDYERLQAQTRGHLRFAVIAWTMALPVMYALLIYLKVAGGLPNANWLFVALFPLATAGSILGGMWLCARSALARARDRETTGRVSE